MPSRKAWARRGCRKSRLAVEIHKGFGLARYFAKRAETPMAKLGAVLLLPAILVLSVVRAGLRHRPRRAS